MSEEGKAAIRAAAAKRWAGYRKTKEEPKEGPKEGPKEERFVAYMIRSSKGDRFLITNLSEQFIGYLKDNGLEVWTVSLLRKM
jgi:hypothetical protein